MHHFECGVCVGRCAGGLQSCSAVKVPTLGTYRSTINRRTRSVDLTLEEYYRSPEHRSDPSIGQSHILAGERDGVTRELEKWSALIGSDTFCPIEGSD